MVDLFGWKVLCSDDYRMFSYNVKISSQKIKGNVVSREMTSIKSKQMSVSCFLGMNYVLLQHGEIVIHVASSQKLLRFANC